LTEPREELISITAFQQIGADQLDRDGSADIRVLCLKHHAHRTTP
jgi:hypothetical protein